MTNERSACGPHMLICPRTQRKANVDGEYQDGDLRGMVVLDTLLGSSCMQWTGWDCFLGFQGVTVLTM